ncbi:MerR family transcriptional regulator [Lysinibacillus sp. 54212]|uniref:MerR family transcriptional regulator n=1 Tax=Lysinibacillus sp. 54212 TaxID=3119829 RepID=UPI002FC86888
MNSNAAKWHYNITQVSEITGLSKQVIRKWEERYRLVQPERLENGHRVYNEKDLQLLLKVRNLSQQGYSIKQAVVIAQEQEAKEELSSPSIKHVEEGMNDFFFLLLEKGAHCNENELNRILQQAHHSLGLSKFLSTVVIPFMKEIGNRWEKKEWTEYQEAVSSMIVRDYLVQIRRNFPYKEDAPLIMGACLPGEYHEVPLHILLLQAMMAGWKSFLVGSSPALGAIESLVEQLQPKVVLLSASTTLPFESHPTLLEGLDRFAAKHRTTRFYIGGAGSIEFIKGYPLQSINVVNDIEEIINLP